MHDPSLSPDGSPGEPGGGIASYGNSIGDVMSVMLMLFMLLFMVTLLQLRKQQEDVYARRIMVIQALKEAFDKEAIQLQVDPQTGDVSLTDSVLFAEASAALKPEGRDFLSVFIPVYASVIFSSPMIEEEVVRVVVEGHTSSKGSFADNLSLSMRRATTVTDFIARDIDFPEHERFVNKLLGAGRGEIEARQDLDDESDRRVLFRFQFKGTEIQGRLEAGTLRATMSAP